MIASYVVNAEPDRDLLRITLSGFFDPSRLAAFDDARHAAHARLRCAPNQHLTLIDVRDFRIQAQDVFERFRTMIAEPGTRARRLAFVAGDAAIRLQVRRIAQRADMRCFADMASAEAWLAEPASGFARAG